ncbi:helix-turn-helix domain-containing protein [Burkholderia gladioli]
MSEIEQLQLIERTVELALERHAARTPRPSHVTITQAAEMLGLSRHTVSKMVHSNQMKLNRCGLIPIEQVDAMLRAR